jgi:hypothetical protein
MLAAPNSPSLYIHPSTNKRIPLAQAGSAKVGQAAEVAEGED